MFAAGCEHLISHAPSAVLTDDEYGLLTYYIAELQAILKARRTQEDALLASLTVHPRAGQLD